MPLDPAKKGQCADCFQCQGCSQTRCRGCLRDGKRKKPCELGTGFTYGQYMEWKKGHENVSGCSSIEQG